MSTTERKEEGKEEQFFTPEDEDKFTLQPSELGHMIHAEHLLLQEENMSCDSCHNNNSQLIANLVTIETTSMIDDISRLQETDAAEFLQREGLLFTNTREFPKEDFEDPEDHFDLEIEEFYPTETEAPNPIEATLAAWTGPTRGKPRA